LLPHGTVYTAAIDDGRVSRFRLEATLATGTGTPRSPAGQERGLKESVNRAWAYLPSVRDRTGLTDALVHKDVAAEVIDLSGGRAECTCGVAFFPATLAMVRVQRVQDGTVVPGDSTIQGNVNALASISEVLQLALDNGALRALLQTGKKSQIAGLPEEVVEGLDVVIYSEVDRTVA
jgi:ATP-dependent Lon protease